MKKYLSRIKLAANVLRYGRLPQPGMNNLPAITPEQVAEVQGFFPIPKFFIFGHARSGTTLLARLVRLHPEVHCNWQAHFFTRPPLLRGMVANPEVIQSLNNRSNRWNNGEEIASLMLRVAADFLMEREAQHEGKSVAGDKSPNSLLDGQAVRELHTIYPDARLIFIVRDGRDVLVSHRFQNFIDASDQLSEDDLAIRDAFVKDSQPFFARQRSIFTARSIPLAARNWVANVEQTHQLGVELYGERYYSLRYEDLLEKPFAEMVKVWAFMSQATPAELEKPVVAEMNRNPDSDWQRKIANDLIAQFEKGKQGSWRDLFTSQDVAVFKEIASQTLIDWGYEKDLDW
jgi:hypothetical protein